MADAFEPPSDAELLRSPTPRLTSRAFEQIPSRRFLGLDVDRRTQGFLGSCRDTSGLQPGILA